MKPILSNIQHKIIDTLDEAHYNNINTDRFDYGDEYDNTGNEYNKYNFVNETKYIKKINPEFVKDIHEPYQGFWLKSDANMSLITKTGYNALADYNTILIDGIYNSDNFLLFSEICGDVPTTYAIIYTCGILILKYNEPNYKPQIFKIIKKEGGGVELIKHN